ncbi:hypothetical protein VIA_001608 [Vibrio orientalis CIP 102891 = ATCC 33934]|uniref:Uncharacterized protein n=1 Tax=Vibrio orientalis CIP 102891 = ATCC 33934 TaxID=675816 RepID=A0ABP2H5W8_VIBOR|nr:hypothetical protein VIA_001608 [Vibrio orientalis CIP 102891 = ATCC 33934]
MPESFVTCVCTGFALPIPLKSILGALTAKEGNNIANAT